MKVIMRGLRVPEVGWGNTCGSKHNLKAVNGPERFVRNLAGACVVFADLGTSLLARLSPSPKAPTVQLPVALWLVNRTNTIPPLSTKCVEVLFSMRVDDRSFCPVPFLHPLQCSENGIPSPPSIELCKSPFLSLNTR